MPKFVDLWVNINGTPLTVKVPVYEQQQLVADKRHFSLGNKEYLVQYKPEDKNKLERTGEWVTVTMYEKNEVSGKYSREGKKITIKVVIL